jgi:excisionase family DNA binding protein
MDKTKDILTLETLPKAFTLLVKEVSEIKQLLLEKSIEQQTQTETWFDLKELCYYLPDKPSKNTVYGWVHSRKIPFHKGEKKLRFLKSEIDEFLLQGKNKTLLELNNEAELYLKTKKG